MFPSQPNGTDLSNFTDGHSSWTAYLENLGKDATWGDHVVLFAAANLYSTPIRVISSLPGRDDIIINPDPPVFHSSDGLVLGHIQEVHYVSLIPGRA